jgi:hypothetical protein
VGCVVCGSVCVFLIMKVGFLLICFSVLVCFLGGGGSCETVLARERDVCLVFGHEMCGEIFRQSTELQTTTTLAQNSEIYLLYPTLFLFWAVTKITDLITCCVPNQSTFYNISSSKVGAVGSLCLSLTARGLDSSASNNNNNTTSSIDNPNTSWPFRIYLLYPTLFLFWAVTNNRSHHVLCAQSIHFLQYIFF